MKFLASIGLALFFLALLPGMMKAEDRTIPVKVSVRKSMMSNVTLVAQFTNLSDKPLPLQVVFNRASGDVRKTFTFTLNANGWKEIGKTQGWTVHSGDKLEIFSDGYTVMNCHLR